MPPYSWKMKSDAFWEVPIEDDGLFIAARDAIDWRSPEIPKSPADLKAVYEDAVFTLLVEIDSEIKKLTDAFPNDIKQFEVILKPLHYRFVFCGISIDICFWRGFTAFQIYWKDVFGCSPLEYFWRLKNMNTQIQDFWKQYNLNLTVSQTDKKEPCYVFVMYGVDITLTFGHSHRAVKVNWHSIPLNKWIIVLHEHILRKIAWIELRTHHWKIKSSERIWNIFDANISWEYLIVQFDPTGRHIGISIHQIKAIDESKSVSFFDLKSNDAPWIEFSKVIELLKKLA